MLKMYFIILSYEDDPIRVEKTYPLLKTYTHRCEPERFSVQARNDKSPFLFRESNISLQLFNLYFKIDNASKPHYNFLKLFV
jgi:hypothetical protein